MRYNVGRKTGWFALLISALLMASACNVGDTANRQPTPDDQVEEDTGNDPEEDTGNDPNPEEDTGNDPDPEEDTGNDPEPAAPVGSIVQQSSGAQKASSESYQLRLNLGAPTPAPAESASYKARPATAAGN
ncbi:hypothetical protein FRC96_01930 [Lujinxingia vulgaris]|uniref:Secreted protein n=1 Tax=Lujinxingia vulgaris TaxID=2600176 RepID=A0A5C6XT04_9DELT|nr:hypothetical protein [Lujinxingia vulgaris]TXD43342.1 hypothetical protein FRC96_01930 [Lujinxingia vulgaris]